MDNTLARFLAYGTFLVDGNVVTNEMSIGSKSAATGPDPPAPAIVGGLDTHAVFEGQQFLCPKYTHSFNIQSQAIPA